MTREATGPAPLSHDPVEPRGGCLPSAKTRGRAAGPTSHRTRRLPTAGTGSLCDRHRVAFPNRRSAWGRSSQRRRVVLLSVIAVGVATGTTLSVAGHSTAGGVAFALLGVILAFLNLTTPSERRDSR